MAGHWGEVFFYLPCFSISPQVSVTQPGRGKMIEHHDKRSPPPLRPLRRMFFTMQIAGRYSELVGCCRRFWITKL
jgi:hypothetical protein